MVVHLSICAHAKQPVTEDGEQVRIRRHYYYYYYYYYPHGGARAGSSSGKLGLDKTRNIWYNDSTVVDYYCTTTAQPAGARHERNRTMDAKEWNGSEIAWVLAEVPLEKRQAGQKAGYFTVPDLTVYHVTDAANVASIRQHGLQARSSRQSYDRPAAVYAFVVRDEIDADTIAILGIKNPVVLTVDVPSEAVLTKMRWDGLYNVGFYTRTAVQYLDDVPPEWIR